MSETHADARAYVRSQVAKTFAQHVLTERRPWFWKVARSDSWCYGFYVCIMPGAIAFYGDLGEAILRMSEGSEENVLAWLRGARGSQDYLMGKLANREAYRQFYPGDALANAEQVGGYFLADVQRLEQFGDLSAFTWYEACQEHNTQMETGECKNWSSQAYWIAEALAVFVGLHDADTREKAD